MKNIIKRVISGVLIALCLIFIRSCEVKAETYGNIGTYSLNKTADFTLSQTSLDITNTNTNLLKNVGKGVVIFGITAISGVNNFPPRPVTSVALKDNAGNLFQCDIGNSTYEDNTSIVIDQVITATCYVNITGSNNYLTLIRVNSVSSGGQTLTIKTSNYLTFVGEYVPNYDSIISAIQSVTIQQQQINTSINNQTTAIENQTTATQEQTDFLKDTSTPDSSEYDFSSNNANNGVINQLVTMPITLTQAFLNGFNGGCSPYNLGNLLGTDLILPCIYPNQYLGAVWNIIDVIISGLFIYVFGKRLVKIFNDVTNMKENQIDEVFD